MKICPLCNIREATKKNCHIFPRFLGESMKSIDNRCQIIEIDESIFYGEKKIKQDTAKENFLLCPECEDLIAENYETKVANTFYKKRNITKTYDTKTYNNFECRKYRNLDYRTFKLFCYTLLFRASIANVFPFKKFQMPKSYEMYLANQILRKEEFKDIPIYAFILKGNYDHTRNVQLIRPYDKQSDIIHIVANDIMLIIDLFGKRKSLESYDSFCSCNNEILFREVNPNDWDKWLESIFYKQEFQIRFDKISEIIYILMNNNSKLKDK